MSHGNNSSVLISLGLLAGSKVLNVSVPFLFKGAVDAFGALNMNSAPETVLALSTSLLIGCKYYWIRKYMHAHRSALFIKADLSLFRFQMA